MAFTSRASLSSFSALFTSAAVLTAIAFAPGCSSGDVPIGTDGTSTRNGDGTSDGGSGGGSGGGTSTDGGSGGADAEPNGCVIDSDCPTDYHCGFLVADLCAAKGQCLPPEPEPNCTLLVSNCACDGTTVYTGCTDLPQGYASKPVAEANSTCGNAQDGGPSPTTCTTNTDCGFGFECGFKESDACGATGSCFAISGAECATIEPACGCDGNIYNQVCTGLPDGYTFAPVIYPLESQCPKDGGTGASDAGPH